MFHLKLPNHLKTSTFNHLTCSSSNLKSLKTTGQIQSFIVNELFYNSRSGDNV